MRIAEEPFLTRESILSVFRPGEASDGRPLRTLRKHKAASKGLSISVRTSTGHVIGSVHLYNALNADAARAYRLRQFEEASELARRAGKLETSRPAKIIIKMIKKVATSMPADPCSAQAPSSLQHYIRLRKHFSRRALDPAGLSRDWLAHSIAWLTVSEQRQLLADAVVELAGCAAEARNDVLGAERVGISTFYGIVERMDASAAEIGSESGEQILVPRLDLERVGLATLGQPVALLNEQLPGGGSYSLPMAAVAVELPEAEESAPVWETEIMPDGAMRVANLNRHNSRWFGRALAAKPTARPAAPLRVRR